MKKIYLNLVLLVFGSTIISCGSDEGSEGGSVSSNNTAPTIPVQVFPSADAICIDNNVLFEWNTSTDAEGNSISYKIEVSEDNSFTVLSNNETSFSQSAIIRLERGKAYYWRIKAFDGIEESAYSPVVQFVTEGEGTSNHVPYAPALVSPSNESEIEVADTVVTWSSSDVDGDPLTYDVYFGTDSASIAKVADNQTESSYGLTGLSSGTKYYFKVVVKDDKGAASIGQIWNFTTK